jgi:hypothetical protein
MNKYGLVLVITIILLVSFALGCCGASTSTNDHPTANYQTPTTSGATSQPATSQPTLQPTAKPSTVGLSKSNPAPIGTTITYTPSAWASSLYGSTCKITLLQVIKGADANAKLKEANMFNSPANKDSDDFLMAKFKVELIDVTSSNKDKAFKIDSYSNFDAVSSDGTRVYEKSLAVYDSSLDGELFNGGSLEGWVILEAAKTDSAPLIVFDRDYNGAGGVWFKTS